ncbi:MAG: TldD/PmbA family protein [Planctomycetota bacterium]|nr:TldD/PmbA family protein [Planctomycetota bacterium]
MRSHLESILAQQSGWVELRYHRRLLNDFTVQKGRVDVANSSVTGGIGVRVLEGGSWGFASTVDTSTGAIEAAIDTARANAVAIAKVQTKKIPDLPTVTLAKGEVTLPGYDELMARPLEEKLSAMVSMEREAAGRATEIHTARASYREIFEDKVVVTTDGASVSQKLVRPELRLVAFASKDGEQNIGHTSLGVTGGWDCLFNHHKAGAIIEDTARSAVDLLGAPHLPGGKTKVILEPSVVGLLSHEAIGHTVEADFVMSGSVAAGKIGQRVATDLVTLCDSGAAEFGPNPGGLMTFDDEGVPTENTVIIEDGIFKSYLHNRESAAHFDVQPTGNARAWLYHDEPLIRMRNTYISPGETSFEQMVETTKKGFLLVGAGSGQADATGEFMFGTDYAVEIKDGKLGQKFKEATISGVAFDVLGTVDAVSSEFKWDLGAGYCGKWQPAKVDAGGPYVRCDITLGGRQ